MFFNKKESISDTGEQNEPTDAETVLGSEPSFEEHMQQIASEKPESSAIVEKAIDGILKNQNSWDALSIAHKNIETALSDGADPDELASELPSWAIQWNVGQLKKSGANFDVKEVAKGARVDALINYIDDYMEYGADIDMNSFINRLDSWQISSKLASLAGYGGDVDKMVDRMRPSDIATDENLNLLDVYGASVDYDKVARGLDNKGQGLANISKHFLALKEHGANIGDLTQMVDNPRSLSDLVENWQELEDAGLSLDYVQCAEKMKSDPIVVAANLDTFVNKGVDIDVNALKEDLGWFYIYEANNLIKHGANIEVNEELFEKIKKQGSDCVLSNIDLFVENGVPFDIDKMVDDMGWDSVGRKADILATHGANVGKMIEKMGAGFAIKHLDTLEQYGDINVDSLVDDLLKRERNAGAHETIANNLGKLLSSGISVDKLMSGMMNSDIINHMAELTEAGAKIDVSSLIESSSQEVIVRNLDTFLEQGGDAVSIAEKMGPHNIVTFLDKLVSKSDIGSIGKVLQDKLKKQ